VGVGRAVVFALQNALVHHRQRHLGAGRGAHRYGLEHLRAALRGGFQGEGQVRAGLFHRQRHETPRHGQRQRIVGDGPDGGGRDVDIRHVPAANGDAHARRFLVGIDVEMVEHA
nr:hypothetical protein [Tanacetum cinerariifolium]